MSTAAAPYYSRKLRTPATRLDGLRNFVQMIINQAEAGNSHEALLIAVDLHDTLSGQANPFASITADKDNRLLDEMKRQHATEMAAAVARAHANGIAEGRRQHKAEMAKALGLVD